MHPSDLPENLLQSIAAEWHLSSREETLTMAGHLLMYTQAITDYVRAHPRQVREQLANLAAKETQ